MFEILAYICRHNVSDSSRPPNMFWKTIKIENEFDFQSLGPVLRTDSRKRKKEWQKRIRHKPGSNQRPSDLQSDALPTELSRLVIGQKALVYKPVPLS